MMISCDLNEENKSLIIGYLGMSMLIEVLDKDENIESLFNFWCGQMLHISRRCFHIIDVALLR